MYRQTFRSSKHLRCKASNLAPPRQRFLSTAPPHQRPRSWKSSAARWSIAIAGVYFYNTNPVFAEQPAALNYVGSDEDSDESAASIDSVRTPKGSSVLASATSDPSPTPPASSENHRSESPNAAANPSELEEEAHSEGAFNPITGEINWDCPCLGGMAYGPCGEQFRSAFSCFVFSTEEPKGMDCIEQFQGMQECFKAHPDIYAAELAEDDIPEEEMDEAMREEKRKLDAEVQERRAAIEEREGSRKRLLDDTPAQPIGIASPPSKSSSQPQTQPNPSSSPPLSSQQSTPNSSSPSSDSSLESDAHPSHSSNPTTQAAKSAKEQVKQNTTKEVFDEELELMPKEWHDQRDAKAESEKDKRTEK